jgi:hypothetical protein
MRRCMDAVVLFALLVLLALFVNGHTQPGAATVKSTNHRPQIAPSITVDGPPTRFDLLFREPELARP